MAIVPTRIFGRNDAAAGGRAMVKVTKAVSDLPDGVCRALLCGTAGTANLIDAAGNTCTDVPLQQGWNPIAVRRVSTGGTADDIWAIY